MAKLNTPTSEPKTAGDFHAGGNVRQALLSFVERVERLEEEKSGLAADIKEVYGEAKGQGFDSKTLRKVISRRKMDSTARQNDDATLEMYEEAIAEAEREALAKSVAEGV